ncbi:S-layer homology domain-containing protein [Nodosilinea nodulosa]|uniref:S-layer homology domain-containing protein n=1 Tax=Nodosilinea nodulosa TaxID=416001 RepID=UPI0002F264ED|nr:S-layer homology domain-containing protein [Nodosilinea nodulosa]
MDIQPMIQGAVGLGLGIGLGVLAAIAPASADTVNSAAEPAAQAAEPNLVLPFTDVPPDHWAYAALLNLAGTYGCVSGYPDGSFRGDDPVTRYEFAAGLDSCLSVLSNLAQQQQAQQGQSVQELIDAMEQSLGELRQLDTELPDTP